jgi:hypothetical protein
MSTTREGPPLEALLRRVTETPADFLADPRIGSGGQVHVPAVVGDLVELFGGFPTVAELEPFEPEEGKGERNRLAIVLMLCWLLADDGLRDAHPDRSVVLRLLDEDARELAGAGPAKRYLSDPDRREEMVRLTLDRLGLRPAGESEAQAEDRLSSLSSAERARVIGASRVAEERARAIREALARKAAEESADKWTRE